MFYNKLNFYNNLRVLCVTYFGRKISIVLKNSLRLISDTMFQSKKISDKRQIAQK
jgi:hypothetical protein